VSKVAFGSKALIKAVASFEKESESETWRYYNEIIARLLYCSIAPFLK